LAGLKHRHDVAFPKRSHLEGPRSKRAFIGGSRLGFEGVYRHDFRKTVVTLMDEAGLSVQSAANQLGHVKNSLPAHMDGPKWARLGWLRWLKILPALSCQEPHPE
jgi:hypothetical protein